jgi:predicted RND superfamily exporter protein
LWRVHIRVPARRGEDYGRFLQRLETGLQPVLAQRLASGQLQVLVCGGLPLVHLVQRQLLHDLIWSFVTAFGLVTLTMILAVGGVTRALLAMIPNLLPAVWVFGTLGWLGIKIDVGTMMTASAALGIAVDDTLHFTTRFREALADGLDRRAAVLDALRVCGSAMIQTSLICGFGLLVFSLSPFLPIARFSWMLFAMLMLALVADLVVWPAVLLGPLGRVFESRIR